ncbi:MAG: hypothetical protein KKF77_15470 [Proteobacteria bacterium]|nr:hypothetical protein [Pseudomonadota bacterium]
MTQTRRQFLTLAAKASALALVAAPLAGLLPKTARAAKPASSPHMSGGSLPL